MKATLFAPSALKHAGRVRSFRSFLRPAAQPFDELGGNVLGHAPL